ncbi:MAG: 2Fe-2S iron-sulfur cluster-binding protein [Novosphingobium sp.]
MFSRWFAKRPPPKVSIPESGLGFEVGRNETVLEAALKSGIAYPHDCTVGTCGSCRTRLLEGKVDAITPFGYTLSREELQAGYILACQAVPESDLVISVPLGGSAPRATAGRIVAQRQLTHDIRAVTWEVAAPVEYRAGQYMSVHCAGMPGPRSYSFSNAPLAGGRSHLSAFVRLVPGGAFTEALFAGQLDDAEFTIEAPHGGFWLREGEGPIVLVGGGSGLSPLMSLLEDAVARGIARDAILLFGARTERDLYCLDEIAQIASRWRGRFEFRPVLSDEQVAGRRHGLVTAEIPSALMDLGGSAGVQGYLCGPPGMIDAGVAVLVAAGVPVTSIFYDKFTDAGTGKS